MPACQQFDLGSFIRIVQKPWQMHNPSYRLRFVNRPQRPSSTRLGSFIRIAVNPVSPPATTSIRVLTLDFPSVEALCPLA